MPSVIAITRDAPFRGDRDADDGGMDVMAVADELGGDVVAREDRADQPGIAMRHRPHAIEQMRRVTWRRRRSPPAPPRTIAPEWPSDTRMPARDERADEIEPAIELGRERDDADVGAVALDDVQDVAAVNPPIRPRDGRAAAAGTRRHCAAAARRGSPD